MVRRAERSRAEQTPRERPDDGMNLGRLERLLERHVGQNPGQALREHRLTRAGRSDEQNIVPARGGNLERALGNAKG